MPGLDSTQNQESGRGQEVNMQHYINWDTTNKQPENGDCAFLHKAIRNCIDKDCDGKYSLLLYEHITDGSGYCGMRPGKELWNTAENNTMIWRV